LLLALALYLKKVLTDVTTGLTILIYLLALPPRKYTSNLHLRAGAVTKDT